MVEHLLQKEEELLSNWWKEYAECSEGPRERASSIKKSDVQASSTESVRSAELYEVEEERVGVPVKGGLYEVSCFPLVNFLALPFVYFYSVFYYEAKSRTQIFSSSYIEDPCSY